MKNWKHGIIAVIAALAFISLSCATNPKVKGLSYLDEALDAAIAEIEAKLPSGSTIVVAAISAPDRDTGMFIADELTGRFTNLITLARDAALQQASSEQMFQMTGLVSDASATGIGHYLGAQAVVSGELKRYEGFNQLRLRIVDVETSQILIYSARIPNNDPILTNVMPPASTIQAIRVTANALDHLNRGKDFLAEDKLDEAIAEFDKALAIDRNLAEAYLYRGIAYYYESDLDRAIADYNQVIRLNPNDATAYNNRGQAYLGKGDLDRVMADYNQAIRLDPNDAVAYYNRAYVYFSIMDDLDRAIAELDQAIRLDPNFADAYNVRGLMYYQKGNFDRAIADWEVVLRFDPDNDDVRGGLEMIREERGR